MQEERERLRRVVRLLREVQEVNPELALAIDSAIKVLDYRINQEEYEGTSRL